MNESLALPLLLKTALKLVKAQEKAASGLRIAFINAFAHPLLLELKQHVGQLCLVQTFKPDMNDLISAGLVVTPFQGEFDVVLLIPGKDKVQSLGWMASAFDYLRDAGKLIVACENQYGAKSYESALKKLAGVAASNSKSKCRLFSTQKTEKLDVKRQQTWLDEAKPKRLLSHGLWAQAGLFSWKAADVGSQLLIKHLPSLEGEGMDLCCGYGLLSAHILNTSKNIKQLHMVEAEALALACAKKNVSSCAHVSFYHADASCESLPEHLNWIVCNPPFHTGQSRDVELGKTIVTRACESLTYNGQLFMVANRQLPYEKILKTHLREVEVIAVGQGFKVIKGKK